jgi:hypothetical protein
VVPVWCDISKSFVLLNFFLLSQGHVSN